MPKLPTIPYDKALHFIYGAAVAVAAMYLLMAIFGVDRYAAKIVGFVAAAVMGAAKEGIDHVLNKRALKAGKPAVHTASGMDALATALGGLLVALT